MLLHINNEIVNVTQKIKFNELININMNIYKKMKYMNLLITTADVQLEFYNMNDLHTLYKVAHLKKKSLVEQYNYMEKLHVQNNLFIIFFYFNCILNNIIIKYNLQLQKIFRFEIKYKILNNDELQELCNLFKVENLFGKSDDILNANMKIRKYGYSIENL